MRVPESAVLNHMAPCTALVPREMRYQPWRWQLDTQVDGGTAPARSFSHVGNQPQHHTLTCACVRQRKQIIADRMIGVLAAASSYPVLGLSGSKEYHNVDFRHWSYLGDEPRRFISTEISDRLSLRDEFGVYFDPNRFPQRGKESL